MAARQARPWGGGGGTRGCGGRSPPKKTLLGGRVGSPKPKPGRLTCAFWPKGRSWSMSYMAEERAIAVNRKALHDYEVLSSVEAGLSLTGSEIKSIREGRVNLRDAFARPEKGELLLYNCHIAPYSKA